MGPLPEAIGYTLRRAQLQVFAEFHRAFAANALGPASFSVLVLIAHNPGVSAVTIGDALAIKRANLVPLLADFEERGWLRRQVEEYDKRRQGLFLTPLGASFAAKMERRHRTLEAAIARQMGADKREELLALLRLLMQSANR
jgi:DNA-binding MarR family transcriptional regulator